MAVHPFVPVPGVIRLALEGVQNGRPFANVFHVQYTSAPPTAFELEAWVAAWVTDVMGAMQSNMSEEASWNNVVATDLSSISAAQINVPQDVPGLLTGVPIPQNACALINYNSSFRYRGGHPRSYVVAGVQASIATPTTWSSPFITDLQTAASAVLDSFDRTVGTLVCTNQCAVSYRLANAWRTVPPYVIMPIDLATASPGIATMRRRMRK
jgi:hypothetical protein